MTRVHRFNVGLTLFVVGLLGLWRILDEDSAVTHMEAVGWLMMLTSIGMLGTRRVLVAWSAYFDMRRHPRFQNPRAARWLWLATLAYANNTFERDARGKRIRRRKKRTRGPGVHT